MKTRQPQIGVDVGGLNNVGVACSVSGGGANLAAGEAVWAALPTLAPPSIF